jgi:hypothetical protein
LFDDSQTNGIMPTSHSGGRKTTSASKENSKPTQHLHANSIEAAVSSGAAVHISQLLNFKMVF